MSDDNATEHPFVILSENPIEQIWTQLSAWESRNLARKLIAERAHKADTVLSEDALDGKAQALSYCIRTARENMRIVSAGLTVGNLCNYYGGMWLAAAMLAADPTNNVDLPRLEAFTKRGHGLGNLAGDGQFPENEHLYLREGGFFREFLKARGVARPALSEMSLSGASLPPLGEMTDQERGRLISLDSLFARVPELRTPYEYVTGHPALSFGISHAHLNMAENFQDPGFLGASSGAAQRQRDYTWLNISGSAHISRERCEDVGLPLTDIDFKTFALRSNWVGKLKHPAGTYWYNNIALHRSAMTGTSWIAPVLGQIEDVFAIHLMLLYALSILARYRPAVWREVLEGSLDQYRALIVGYADIAHRVLPELALKTISSRRIHVTMPGSLMAPI